MRYGAADWADNSFDPASAPGTIHRGKDMRKRKGAFVALVAAATFAVPITTAGAGTSGPAAPSAAAQGAGEFVVFYADGVDTPPRTPPSRPRAGPSSTRSACSASPG